MTTAQIVGLTILVAIVLLILFGLPEPFAPDT